MRFKNWRAGGFELEVWSGDGILWVVVVMVYGDSILEDAVDKQGRIVIPKKIREKYGLSEEGKLELVAREDAIELIPLSKEDDLAIRSLREPCKTGNPEAHDRAFSRENAWKR